MIQQLGLNHGHEKQLRRYLWKHAGRVQHSPRHPQKLSYHFELFLMDIYWDYRGDQ